MNQTTFLKTDRLLNAKEFKQVFDHPIKKIHSPHLLMFVSKGQNQPKLGLAITKKKLKCAVDRNRIKRLTREHFRRIKSELDSVELVLIVKSGYDREFDIGNELTEIFGKVKKIYEIK